MKPISGLMIAAVSLSACARKADKIPPSYSSGFMYEAYPPKLHPYEPWSRTPEG
jgi:hypothetical protein